MIFWIITRSHWSRLCEYLEGVIVQFDDLKGWEGDPIAQYERDECRRVNALDLIALGANGWLSEINHNIPYLPRRATLNWPARERWSGESIECDCDQEKSPVVDRRRQMHCG